jgi:hypothetical protein
MCFEGDKCDKCDNLFRINNLQKAKLPDFIKKIFRQSTFLKIYGIYTNLWSVGPPPPPPSMGPKLGDRFIFNTPIAIVGIWFASLARRARHRASLCLAMTARHDVGSVARHRGKVRARVRASSRQGGKVARWQGATRSSEALRQGARRGDEALRQGGKVRGVMIYHRGIVRRDRADRARHRARSMRTRRLGGGVTMIYKTYQRRAPDKNIQSKRMHIYSQSILNLGL